MAKLCLVRKASTFTEMCKQKKKKNIRKFMEKFKKKKKLFVYNKKMRLLTNIIIKNNQKIRKI